MLPNNVTAALTYAIEMASRSPSSHNSQPWELAVVQTPAKLEQMQQFLATVSNTTSSPSICYLVLAANHHRYLRSLPSHRLEMMLSCGIYLEALLIGLAARNWRGEVNWYKTDTQSWPATIALPAHWEPLAIISLVENSASSASSASHGQEKASQLVTWFPQRITNRAPYQPQPIAAATMQRLTRVDPWLCPTIPEKVDITLSQDSEQIALMGRFIAQYAAIDFIHASAWRETYRFIHFTPEAIHKAETGMPITQLFGPLPAWKQYGYRWLLSPPLMQLLRFTPYPTQIAKGLAGLLQASPAVGYMSFRESEIPFANQLASGALILQFWLQAAQAGLVLHPISVLLQHPTLRATFAKAHGLPAGRGFFFFRIGYPQHAFPPAPKRQSSWQKICQI